MAVALIFPVYPHCIKRAFQVSNLGDVGRRVYEGSFGLMFRVFWVWRWLTSIMFVGLPLGGLALRFRLITDLVLL